MATRIFKGPSVYAEAASDDPSSPSTGTGYRDPSITNAQIQSSLKKYDSLARSAIENEYLFRLSTLVDLIERTGILGWNAETSYIAGSVVVGNDNAVYQAVQANLNVDPTTDPGTNWVNYADVSLTSSLDTLFPIGSILVGGTNPSTRGFAGAWEAQQSDITISSTQPGVGENQILGDNTPSVPLPAHSHTKGNMNITGTLISDSRQNGKLIRNTTGAFTQTDSLFGDGAESKASINTPAQSVSFNASNAWTGSTSSEGSAGATLDVRGARIKSVIWLRTA
jgi:hypothetical protein